MRNAKASRTTIQQVKEYMATQLSSVWSREYLLCLVLVVFGVGFFFFPQGKPTKLCCCCQSLRISVKYASFEIKMYYLTMLRTDELLSAHTAKTLLLVADIYLYK